MWLLWSPMGRNPHNRGGPKLKGWITIRLSMSWRNETELAATIRGKSLAVAAVVSPYRLLSATTCILFVSLRPNEFCSGARKHSHINETNTSTFRLARSQICRPYLKHSRSDTTNDADTGIFIPLQSKYSQYECSDIIPSQWYPYRCVFCVHELYE